MSFPTRPLGPHMRGPSNSLAATSQPPALVARIEEKRAELEHLRELRDLSAAVANQMEALEEKLSTLSDGTQAIATVVSNWHNVLRAINMASVQLAKPPAAEETSEPLEPLPQTLVRIPTEHAPALQAQAEAAEAADGQSTASA